MARARNQPSKELSELMKTIAYRVQHFREQEGLSQNELGRRVSMSKSTVNELETRVATDVRLSTICNLAKILKRRPIELLVDLDIKPSEADKKDFDQAIQSIEQAFRVLDRINRNLK